ncbi:lysoplasmalogenase [Paenibacillus marinisediminis]
MKKWLLPVAILVMGILYIFFIPNLTLFKLIPMWLILIYAYLQRPDSKDRYFRLALVGLFFCMLGDGFIEWSFVAGLSAFLIGHLFYAGAFLTRWRFSWPRFLTIIPIAVYFFFMWSELQSALKLNNEEVLLIPVLCYMIAISVMGWLSIMTGNKWAIIGGLLFMVSDSILGWNMFVSDVAYADTLIMVTYYSAQFLIARSIYKKQIRYARIGQF